MTNKRSLHFLRTNPLLFIFAFLSLAMTNLAVQAKSIATEEATITEVHDELHSQRSLDHLTVQVAILLDTSNSMDGLINQTREQLWQMVDELATMKRNNVSPRLEVAIYQYGNSGLSKQRGYVQEVTAFTGELDRVSEALFSLSTDGGDEYCGFAISKAVQQLRWSKNKNDLRMIFIAGNEPFTQGPINYVDAIVLAKEKDINITTIYAGDYQEGLNSGWQRGALLADGNFMSIDQNHAVAHINAPQDKRINELNRELNSTYIPYGANGKEAAGRQREQDSRSQQVSSAFAAKRAKSKVSSAYKNSQWDLVDAIESGDTELELLEEEALPAAMKAMSDDERKDYVENKKQERENIQKEIVSLGKQRDEYVASVQAEKPASPSMSDALSASIHELAEEKEYEFTKE